MMNLLLQSPPLPYPEKRRKIGDGISIQIEDINISDMESDSENEQNT